VVFALGVVGLTDRQAFEHYDKVKAAMKLPAISALVFPKDADTKITIVIPALFIICGLAVSAATILGSYAAFKNWRLFLILIIYSVIMFICIGIMIAVIPYAVVKKNDLLKYTKNFYELILYPLSLQQRRPASPEKFIKLVYDANDEYHEHVSCIIDKYIRQFF
jgi:hypothetical protein